MKKNILTFVLTSAMVISAISPMKIYGDDKTDFTIKSEADFETFVSNCDDDEWSRDRKVILETDIDLAKLENEFEGIESFAGTFDGNNHTIYDFIIDETNSKAGFFNYIESGAVVKNLTVDITAECNDTCELKVIGAIAGINSGAIKNCQATGSLVGNSVIGGIAGQNGAYGVISGCTVDCYVEAVSTVGGIAGINWGVISSCTNRGGINTTSDWLESDSSDMSLDVSDTVNEETLVAKSDIGGIAGKNNGVIVACTNIGSIGYKNNGYNIGGIAGRTAGTITNCTNEGDIHGKQDIGGIAGQFEPYAIPKDTDTILSYTNLIHDQVETLVNDVNSTVGDTTDSVDELLTHVNTASSLAKSMADEAKSVADADIDSVNDLMERVQYVIDAMPEIMDDMDKASDKASEINDIIARISDTISDLKLSSEDQAEFDENKDSISTELTTISDTLTHAQTVVDDIDTKLNDESTDYELEDLTDELNDLSDDIITIADNMTDAMTQTIRITEILTPYVENATDELSEELSDLSDTLDELYDIITDLQDKVEAIFTYLSSLDTIQFTGFSEDFDTESDNLKSEIDSIIEVLTELNDTLGKQSDVIATDIKNINDTVSNLLNLVVDKYDEISDMLNGETVVVDMSTEENDKTTKITGCYNYGNVFALSNTGGIAGNVGIEDLTDDTTIQIGTKYYVYARLTSCKNYGNIIVQNSCAGGIAGNLPIGLVSACFSRGLISAAGSKNVGGIAGSAKGQIDDCGTMMVLMGNENNENLGGIAGSGEKVTNCYSLAYIDNRGTSYGAIIGSDGEDNLEDISVYRSEIINTVTGNFYVSDLAEGLYGISIKGCAEKITYNELLSKAKSAYVREFRTLYRTYLDENYNKISTETIKYGETIGDKLPTMQAESGKYYTFKDMIYEGKICSDLIYEGSLCEDTNTIYSDSDKTALISGNFTYNGIFTCTVDNEHIKSTKAKEKAITYHLTITDDSLNPNDDYEVRILCDNPAGAQAYSYRDGKWVEISTEDDGKYVGVTMHGSEDIICIVTSNSTNYYWIIFVATGCLVVAGVIVIVVKKKKKH